MEMFHKAKNTATPDTEGLDGWRTG